MLEVLLSQAARWSRATEDVALVRRIVRAIGLGLEWGFS